ncbi:Uncharacterized protein PECH_006691 [Penicillium ucsense]|uniref:RING-type domain-containing protein n=1 Tax=Penicillium ucsense TaxID=2839758 RepID=A0A8J8W8Q5_9EURO|nr:Uncharacterized protein PECM_004362 [Penicillium ucsense]KAF7735389.1 Uncharacterized protein PECH_006691 [Penicillium ucsense]
MAGGGGSDFEIQGLFNTLQGHVDDIRTRLQCGICMRPLYEPFSLACGHTFCYTCLAQWFSGGRSKRTCPDCRAAVKTQPAPAYLVREIVQMFTSRAELLDKGETTHEHLVNRRAETEKLDQDKANTNPHTGGLFGGLFRPKGPPLRPLFDADDGVLRCPRCQWELEENACGGCGWTYRPDDDMTDLSGTDNDDYDEDSDFDSLLDEEPEEEVLRFYRELMSQERHAPYGPHYAVGDADLRGDAFHPLRQFLSGRQFNMIFDHQHLRQGRHDPFDSEYEGEMDFNDEEDEYDEMDSFIDDEENQAYQQNDSDHSTVVGDPRRRNRGSPAHRHGRPVVNLDSSDEVDEDDENDETDGPTESSTFRRNYSSTGTMRRPGSMIPPPPNRRHPAHHCPRPSSTISITSDEVSQEGHNDIMHNYESDSDSDSDGDSDSDSNRESEDEDDTDDEEDVEFSNQPRRCHCRHEIPASSDEEEASEVTGSPSPRPAMGPIFAGLSARSAIPIADSDDEQPVGPIRRAAQRRRARYSPY